MTNTKTALVTGASSGIGEATALKLHDLGYTVYGAARRTDRLQQLATRGIRPVAMDVTDDDSMHAGVAQIVGETGRIDVLVNNAGYGLLSAVEEASARDVERVFATNVFGLLAVTRAVLPQMRRQRSGHVINLSSIGGYSAYPGWGVYGATKFAVEGLTEALAAEVAPLGIKVTVVEPGFFRTDFLDGQSLSVSEPISDYASTSGVTRSHATQLNHAQPGDPTKLARAILALVDAARPPLRLPLGSDTLARIEAKHRSVTEEIAVWRELAVSTDGSTAAP